MNVSAKLRGQLWMALLICLPLYAHAQLFKCKNADGSTVFQDVECPAGADSTQIKTEAPSTPQTMSLIADPRGHFHASLTINDVKVDGVIDTGATLVSISIATANAMHIPLSGQLSVSQTANGFIRTLIKTIPIMRVGNIDLYNVDICITANSPTLIGMDALQRMRMSEENGKMVLTRK